jgi:transposase
MRCARYPGMRADATDLKEHVVRAVAGGQAMREAARRFGVVVTTVKRAVVQQRETGSLARKPIPGRPREINTEHEAIVRTRLETAPDATLQEHCAWRAQHQGQPLGEATMWRAIHRLGWTQKKRHWQPVSVTSRHASPGHRRACARSGLLSCPWEAQSPDRRARPRAHRAHGAGARAVSGALLRRHRLSRRRRRNADHALPRAIDRCRPLRRARTCSYTNAQPDAPWSR